MIILNIKKTTHYMKFKTNTYLFTVLIKGIKLKELVFLLIIVV